MSQPRGVKRDASGARVTSDSTQPDAFKVAVFLLPGAVAAAEQDTAAATGRGRQGGRAAATGRSKTRKAQ
jgi:hypothetical protein